MPPESTEGQPARRVRRDESDAWAALGLVMSGVLVWGGVGALVGAWLHSGIPVMIGLLVGMTAGLYLVWFRYGRA
jgi:F0F1-type ATP synthase assembly protein I